jgi:HAD superfamily hydrolase (TIGR01509 family)
VIDAVIFDLDGLILDSETPEHLAWQAVYRRFGFEFPMASWIANIGRNDGPFDPLAPFCAHDSPASPTDVLHLWRGERAHIERSYLLPLPGVMPLLRDVRRRGWRAGVASSSRITRVRGLLMELDLESHFDAIAGGDEVPHGKPAPDVYLLAAARLGVAAAACAALEDSENGLRAAKAAGMVCVAVPTDLTRRMDFSAADLVVGSLCEVTTDVIARLGERTKA